MHAHAAQQVWRQLAWMAVFAVAMGLLEAICVIYLRRLVTIPGGDMRQLADPIKRFPIEIIREACTLAMLLAAAWMAGFNLRSRVAHFFFAFGVWDVFYYAGLKWLADWPSSWLEWDCLFLIPQPWYGPVLAPVLISAYFAVACCVVLAGEKKGRPIRVSFVAVASQVLAAVAWYLSFVIAANQIARNGHADTRYLWELFAGGMIVGCAGLWLASSDLWTKRCEGGAG
ncbi:MAG: hypothetical protein NTX50_28885 [Candidatus Sumerlaeota bacterium]|nr:hypothetical protein [Candidatus Sumerlaeota bacterium]